MTTRKLFLFDIDGTLVDTVTHQVPTSAKQALQQLKKAGHLLGISTGRSLQSLEDGAFDRLIDWDVFLCNNGQAIYDRDKHVLHSACIPEASVRACIAVAEAQNCPMLIIGKDSQCITREPNAYVRQSHDFFKESIPKVHAYDGTPVIMMIAYGALGYAYDPYRSIDKIHVIPGQSTYADIVLQGYHKYEGIRHVLKHFHMDSYIAFGDSLNDLEMLENAAIGIAMGNAHEELKAVADYITKEVLEDGIAHALVQLELLPEESI